MSRTTAHWQHSEPPRQGARHTPDMRRHLCSMEVMNWSMMHCAVLEKSPNCASQHTKGGQKEEQGSG